MKNDLVFYMGFRLSDDNDIAYGFILENISKDLDTDEFDELLLEITENIEDEFGLHDWSSSPSDKVYGIGFTTYEITEKKIYPLLVKWQNELGNLLNVSCSNIYGVDINLDMDDYDIFQQIKKCQSMNTEVFSGQ